MPVSTHFFDAVEFGYTYKNNTFEQIEQKYYDLSCHNTNFVPMKI